MLNTELVNTVKELIKNGTSYQITKLNDIYHEDLKIARRERNEEVHVINKTENMAFFKSKRDEGAEPLSHEANFIYAHASGPVGHVALER